MCPKLTTVLTVYIMCKYSSFANNFCDELYYYITSMRTIKFPMNMMKTAI